MTLLNGSELLSSLAPVSPAKRGNLESCGGKHYARALDLSLLTGQNQFFSVDQTG